MRARKHLGQHFLTDGNIIKKIIASLAPQVPQHFVEIGPGRGAITHPLIATGVQLDAIEIDRGLAAAWRTELTPGSATNSTNQILAERVRIHCANALRFDFRTLVDRGARLRLVGNLPYNISTPLLFHLLSHGPIFEDLHVMLQKEVGERILAAPHSKTYGRLTIAIAFRCTTNRLFSIAPGSFKPPPQVDSVFLRLIPHATPIADARTLAIADRLVGQAFTMRRKRLSNGLRGLLTAQQIRAAGVDDGCRPEELAPDEWLKLAAFHPTLANGATGLSE